MSNTVTNTTFEQTHKIITRPILQRGDLARLLGSLMVQD
ncbi:hypothetical protein F442_23202 [Phytophthora nicotianae P10297]|uniref:Uncharacterized protein n=1 Tax=Phytophthora nicotianae P10297 TaxID=1317064 RepID=W2XYC0_PHYNI|nr:hypothetical protein F442_23202 [Phytophthora nicotianae P10297]